MPDRTIPFYNTILRCDDYRPREPALPGGFSLSAYKPGFEKAWARLERAIGDFDTEPEAEDYFNRTYLQDASRLEDLLFAVDRNGNIVGACIAWQDRRNNGTVASLHWLVVDEDYQGNGIGRALCVAVMNRFAARGDLPVYIHTQPWSWQAILLYLSLGFRLQQTDTFSHYENQYHQAMETLEKVVTPEQYQRMADCSDCL